MPFSSIEARKDKHEFSNWFLNNFIGEIIIDVLRDAKIPKPIFLPANRVDIKRLLNISDEAIAASNPTDLSSYLDNKELDKEEKLFLLYVNKLHKSRGLIKSCLSEMKDYASLDIEAVRKHSIKPHFILISDQNDIAEEIQKQFGIICLSKDLKKLNGNIYRLFIKQVEQGAQLPPKDYFSNLPEVNSIVIEEPYLLKQNYEYIKTLINSIISSNLKLIPSSITLITQTSEGNLNYIKRLTDEYSSRAIIEHYEKKGVHDRNIYTNSYWVCSDYGFMERYSKAATKWTGFPLGIYYSDYYDRIKKSLTFLKDEKIKYTNYLATGFN